MLLGCRLVMDCGQDIRGIDRVQKSSDLNIITHMGGVRGWRRGIIALFLSDLD